MRMRRRAMMIMMTKPLLPRIRNKRKFQQRRPGRPARVQRDSRLRRTKIQMSVVMWRSVRLRPRSAASPQLWKGEPHGRSAGRGSWRMGNPGVYSRGARMIMWKL
uniref:Uncharacterized protein n=1 Tax=Anguilla anguilla TaxID=7936 RepID=A0A0E9X5I4_ANGAN